MESLLCSNNRTGNVDVHIPKQYDMAVLLSQRAISALVVLA